jgi:SAM-dependent methyltransferase
VKDNLRVWNKKYDWSRGGDEWSSLWGGVEAQWNWMLYPRIRSFVPTGRILEIAPGYGRWTHYLKDLSTSLVLVDVSDRCIEACKRRFAEEDHIRYHVNDGSSLASIEDESIDFVFSFDSLVHVEQDVIDAYVQQLATKLKPEGIAFLHHSNLGAIEDEVEHTHWRARSVSARSVREAADASGLVSIGQELVNFGDRYVGRGDDLIDCFTLLSRTDPGAAAPTRIVENPEFMSQSAMVAELARLYTGSEAGDEAPDTPGRFRKLLSWPRNP